MSNENNNIPEPSIPDWVKILNQYDPTQYQSGKLVKAEEWNALFSAAVAQGNYHSNTLDLLINTYLPEKFEEISEDIAELNTSVNSDITEFKSEVNADIAEIEEAVQQANTTASTAVSNSTSAIQTANAANSKADSAVLTANTASNTANSAKTTAEAISGIAEDAKDIAEATQNSLTNYYTKTETDNLFSNLINGAPEEFDTLKEISDWIANDETGTAALINRVSTLETDMTAAENDLNSITNNTVNIVYSNGGFKAGRNATITGAGAATGNNATAFSGGAVGSGSQTSSGCAVGQTSYSTGGGASGYQAWTQNGGSVGYGTFSTVGFAGGLNAHAGTYQNQIDTIQLGTGENTQEKTLQIYDDNIYNATTHTLTTQNLTLNGADLSTTLSGKQDKTTYEELTVQSTSWTALSNSSPYTYQAAVTLTTTLTDDSVVELLNNQAVLFATYGFVIASISGQVATIYSIGQSTENVNLTMGVTA